MVFGFSIFVLLVVAFVIFFVKKDKNQKPLTPLAGISFMSRNLVENRTLKGAVVS